MILIDSNTPMYLVGTHSPHKTDAQRLLEKFVSERQRLVTDAEVLQEILHRYAAINRHHDIQLAFDALLDVVDEGLSVDRAVAERAKQIVLGYRDQKSGDDGAINPRLRSQSRSDGKRHGQWLGYQPHRDPSDHIEQKFAPVVIPQTED